MINFDLNNRVAIVTGGAQGFGLAITERFIESGAKVVIWDIDENEAKKAMEKVKSKNLSYQIVDVSDFNKINEKLTMLLTGKNITDEIYIGSRLHSNPGQKQASLSSGILPGPRRQINLGLEYLF